MDYQVEHERLQTENAALRDVIIKAEHMINARVSGMAEYGVMDWIALLGEMHTAITRATDPRVAGSE